MPKPTVKAIDCLIQKKKCFTWTPTWDGVSPGLIMNAEGWRRTKHEILALPNRRIPVVALLHTEHHGSWPLQCRCQLPRWCIAMKGLHMLRSGDNKSWSNPNYWTGCSSHMTVQMLPLPNLYCWVWAILPVFFSYVQSWLNLTCQTCAQTSSPFPAQPPFDFYVLYSKLWHNLSCQKAVFFSPSPSTSIFGSYAISRFSHRTWHLVVSHRLLSE